jgi:hypothetical protein
VEERHGRRQRYRDERRANQPRTPTHDRASAPQKFRGSSRQQTACNQAAFWGTLAVGRAAGTQWVPGDANAPADSLHENGLQIAGPHEAAEGIRTLDLLHGKQNVQCRVRTKIPANWRLFDSQRPFRFPGVHREITGIWAPNGYPADRHAPATRLAERARRRARSRRGRASTEPDRVPTGDLVSSGLLAPPPDPPRAAAN